MGGAFRLGWDLGCHQCALDKEVDAQRANFVGGGYWQQDVMIPGL